MASDSVASKSGRAAGNPPRTNVVAVFLFLAQIGPEAPKIFEQLLRLDL